MPVLEGTRRTPRNTRVTIAERQAVAGEKKSVKKLGALPEALIKHCPVRNVLARVSDKWSLLTLLSLGQHGTLRFSELRACIPDVSQRMLTVTLRHLEADGLLTRKVFAEVPPRVEYTLTEVGRGLGVQIQSLAAWANANAAAVGKARKKAVR